MSVCTTLPLFLLARDFNAVRLDNLWPLSEYTCLLITHPARKVEIVLSLLICHKYLLLGTVFIAGYVGEIFHLN